MKKIIFGDCGHPLDSIDPASGNPACSFCGNEAIVDKQNTKPKRTTFSVIIITLAILFCGTPIFVILMLFFFGSA